MADRPGGRSFGSASAYGTGVPPAFGHGLGPAAASRPGTLQHGSERSISGSSGESQQRTHRHGAGAPGGAWHQLTPVCAAARGCLELSDEALRVSVEDASEWPELPKPSLGSSLCPKAFVPTRHVPPVNRAMSKSAQRKANAAARYSQDGQSRRSSDVA
jgi:hypothetical protein